MTKRACFSIPKILRSIESRCLLAVTLLGFFILSPERPHAQPTTLMLQAEGVAGLRPGMSFDRELFQKRFAKYQLKVTRHMSESVLLEAYEVLDGTETLLTIIADEKKKNIAEMRIQSARVTSGFDLNIDGILSAAFKIEELELCEVGHEELAEQVICQDKTNPNILYVFTGNPPAKDGQFPPWEELAHWRVLEIIMR